MGSVAAMWPWTALDPRRRRLAMLMLLPLSVALLALVTEGPSIAASIALPIAGTTLSLIAPFVMHVHDLPEAERRRALVAGAIAELTLLGIGALVLEVPTRTLGLGLALVAVIDRARRALDRRDPGDVRRLFDLLALPVAFLCSFPVLHAIGLIQPHILDASYARVEEGLGDPVARHVARLFAAAPVLAGISLLVYEGFVLGMGIAHACAADDDTRARLLERLWIAGFVGYATYLLVPLIGPAQYYVDVLGAADLLSPPVRASASTAGPELLRNCYPSLHTTWAIVAASVMWPRSRLLAVVWVALTVLATLGTGAHWLVDLVVAVPLATALAAPDRPRRADGIAAISVLLALLSWALVHHLASGWLAAHPAVLVIALALTTALAVPIARLGSR